VQPQQIPTLLSFARTETRPDNIFGSQFLQECLLQCQVFPELRPVNTDHYPIVTEFNLGVLQAHSRERFNYKLTDWDQLRSDLKQQLTTSGLPSEGTSAEDVLEKYHTVTAILRQAVEANVPQKRQSPYMRRWWTSELMKMCKEVNRLR
jgi:hypothetical protein